MFIIALILLAIIYAHDSYAIHKGWRKEWRK
jgi:hypothetical protein